MASHSVIAYLDPGDGGGIGPLEVLLIVIAVVLVIAVIAAGVALGIRLARGRTPRPAEDPETHEAPSP